MIFGRDKIPFPDCYKECTIVGYLGCGECESICPHKFDKNGNELEIVGEDFIKKIIF